MIIDELFEAPQQCPECGGISFSNLILAEKKDACYHKVKASAKVWPSAYASGRLVQCRKKGAANYGNKSEGVMEMDKSQTPPGRDGRNDPDAGKKEYTAKATTPEKVAKHGEKILNKIFNKKKGVAADAAAVDINQIASQMKFLPTTKLAKQYKFVKDGIPGQMPAMTYTVSTQEQPVVTVTSDGKETQNVAMPNDVIMSGPSKENYVVKAAKFPKLYQGTMGGPVIPEQGPRLVALYAGKMPVTFTAPWGESMILKPGDYLVKDGDAGYYRIAKLEYDQTYNQPGSNGQPSVEEGYVPINIYKGPTNPAPKPKKVEPEHKYVDNQVEVEKHYQAREKYFYNIVGKFDRKLLNPQPIKGLRAAEEFMKQNGLGEMNADIEQISTIRFHATGIDASGKRVVSEPLTDMKDVRNFYKQHGIDQFASTTDLTTTDDGSVTEGQLEMNTPDPVVVVQDLKGKILDKINLSVAAQKYKLGQPQNIKNQLAHQNYTTIGNYMIVSPMSGQPQDQTTTGQKQAFTATEGEQQKGADYRDPKEVDYDDEYDAMVARVKKLAGLGPMKTVYDPARRQYRNMPTAQQPKK
jgi:hypothetical protein